MKKNWFVLFAVVLFLAAPAALADDGLGSLLAPETAVSDVSAVPQAVLDAVKAELPNVTIDYVHEEWDDGRTEWEVIYRTPTGGIGSCSVKGANYTVRENRAYEDVTENILSTEEALNVLQAQMGDFTLLELDLDYDDGYLCYEGEAELDGKYYEFEITVSGRIIEWSRD